MSIPKTSIYFVQAGESGPIKIGQTTDLDKRLYRLRHACPYPLRVLLVISDEHHSEPELHKRFRPYRIHSEWFKPAAPLLEFIRTYQPPKPKPKPQAKRVPIPTPGREGYLTPEEVGRSWSTPLHTLKRFAREGALLPVRLDGFDYYAPEQLSAFLDGLRGTEDPPARGGPPSP